jgi:hypothetical protein
MAETVFLLCGLTSLLCAGALFRAHRKTKVRILLWSSLCFVGLTLNNVILFTDFFLVPTIDLSVWRIIPAFIGHTILVFGLIWDTT